MSRGADSGEELTTSRAREIPDLPDPTCTSSGDVTSHRRCRVGLALSGGAARSLAHVGVLKALVEAGIPIDALSGTSGGAVVAVLYGAGLLPDRLEQAVLSLRWRDFGRISLSRMGILSSRPLEALMLSLSGPLRLENLAPPVAVVATNLGRARREVFRSGDAILAARASAAIPHIYRPVEIEGELYADGGIVDFLPVSALDFYRPLVKVAVHLLATETVSTRPRHAGQVVARILHIAQAQNAQSAMAQADAVIEPSVAGFPSFELVNAPALLQAGYEAAREVAPKIRRLLEVREEWLGSIGPVPASEPRSEATHGDPS